MNHEILFAHTGDDVATMRTPIQVWDGEAEFDDYSRADDVRHEVATVSLPDWLPVEEWLHETIKWKFLAETLRTKGLDLEEVPEYIARYLVGLGAMCQLACLKLLATQKFRSEFRASLCSQLEAFMVARWEGRNKHDSPFSSKQWHAICDAHTIHEADRISDEVHYGEGCD